MKNGDISNALTKRVLITIDTFRTSTKEIKRALGIVPYVKTNYSYSRQTLSRYYLLATRSAYTLELVAFDMSEENLAAVIDDLDNAGTNPFRYYTSYDSIDRLVSELPYRPEVEGVLDIPERLLRYGSWGLDASIL